MGYYTESDDVKFFLAKEHIPAFLAELQEKFPKENYDHGDITEVLMREFYYYTRLDQAGNIYSFSFTEGKHYDLEDVCKVMAPYVRSGSYINVLGEDGERWQHYFENGKVRTRNAVVTYVD